MRSLQGVLDGTRVIKFGWVNNTMLGQVLIYYEVHSSVNWGHVVMEGDRSLRLHTPPPIQIGYTLLRRRDLVNLALERIARENGTLANRLLMTFVVV